MTGQEQANQAFISAMIPIALLFLVFIAIVWYGQVIETPTVIEEIQEKETKEIADDWPEGSNRHLGYLTQEDLSEVMQKVVEEQQKMLDEHAKKVCECEQE